MTDTNSKRINRIEGLDLLRVLAILCVVFIHTMPSEIQDIGYFNSLSESSKIFYFACFAVGRLGVPLFMLLSGYLLLSREYNSENTKKFYKENFLSLLLTWEIWIFIYNLLVTWFRGSDFHMSVVVKNMFFVEAVTHDVFNAWYMEMILGIYLFIPFLSRVLKTMSNREIAGLLTIFFIYLFIVPTLNQFRSTDLACSLDLNFSGGIYGFYLIAGYLLKRYENQFRNAFKPLAIPAGLACITALVLLQMLANTADHLYLLWYDFCLLPIASMLIFVYFRDVSSVNLRGLITNISTCSFGIYLFHIVYLALFWHYETFDNLFSDKLRIFLLFISAFILSFISVMILKKIPHLGKLLVR